MKPEPIIGWAIFQYDRTLKENRLVDVYLHGADANRDAIAMSNADNQPTVEPFTIQTTAQYSDTEPALEESSIDFDMPIHVDGEVN